MDMILAIALAAILQEPDPAAVERAQEVRYQACLDKIEVDPLLTREEALQWRIEGGGIAARHCAALALAKTGAHQQAAEELERVAEDFRFSEGGALGAALSVFDRTILSDLYAQTGSLWLLAGDGFRAYDALSAALTESQAFSPAWVELLVDRARASALAGDYEVAVEDLRAAETQMPERADIKVFLATALREMNENNAASQTILRALELAPDNPGALLERGILRSELGDFGGARDDWLRLIQTSPESQEARAAAEQLAALAAAETGATDGAKEQRN